MYHSLSMNPLARLETGFTQKRDFLSSGWSARYPQQRPRNWTASAAGSDGTHRLYPGIHHIHRGSHTAGRQPGQGGAVCACPAQRSSDGRCAGCGQQATLTGGVEAASEPSHPPTRQPRHGSHRRAARIRAGPGGPGHHRPR